MLIDSARGQAILEVLIAATLGLVLAAAAVSLCRFGNGAVLDLVDTQNAWQEARNAATLWSSEWRGAAYDPAGSSGAAIVALTPDTIEFGADWDGDGAIVPTAGNPNERLAYALDSGVWKRGVNGGPRLVLARADSVAFSFRDTAGQPLGPTPPAGDVSIVDVRVVLVGRRGQLPIPIIWSAAWRNRGGS